MLLIPSAVFAIKTIFSVTRHAILTYPEAFIAITCQTLLFMLSFHYIMLVSFQFHNAPPLH